MTDLIDNKVVIFQVRDEDYAIDVKSVISIEKMATVKSIPHLPNYMKGIFSVREQLVPIIDLEQILHGRPTMINDDTKIIVIKTSVMLIGLIVKEAKTIIDLPPNSLNQVGLIGYEKTKYITGIINVNDELITLLNTVTLVETLDGIKDIQAYLNELKLKESQS